MKEFTYTITDPEGIHARPAGELVKAAKAFESAIKLNKEGKSADCKRVFGIMGLAGALSMLFKCTLMAPHGGIFVFPVVGNAIMYLLALVIGTVISTVLLGVLKKPREA